jgi:hypothetical protein
LRLWRPGSGTAPDFLDVEPNSVTWQPLIDDLAKFDASENDAGRSHLISADTYRHSFAAAYGRAGGQLDELELVATDLNRCQAMSLHAKRRVAIMFADLRDPVPRTEAAKSLIRAIYETSIFDANEKVIVLVVGPSGASQARTLFPLIYAEPRKPFRIDLERMESAGPEVSAEVNTLLNSELTLVAQASRPPDGHVLALRVSK